VGNHGSKKKKRRKKGEKKGAGECLFHRREKEEKGEGVEGSENWENASSIREKKGTEKKILASHGGGEISRKAANQKIRKCQEKDAQRIFLKIGQKSEDRTRHRRLPRSRAKNGGRLKTKDHQGKSGASPSRRTEPYKKRRIRIRGQKRLKKRKNTEKSKNLGEAKGKNETTEPEIGSREQRRATKRREKGAIRP